MTSTSADLPSVAELCADRVTAGYREKIVLNGVELTIPANGFTALIGPNACGKSTLLRTLGRLLRPTAGTVLLDGQDIHSQSTRSIARRLGILPQSPTAPDSITVGDLVWRGRHPHQRFGQRRNAADESAVVDALLATGCGDLVDRTVDSLSGGQRQRVWISMALAQDTDLLLLDEPTTYLDVNHQIEVMDLLSDLNRIHHKTILLVSHDLNQAARYADTVVAMRDGEIRAVGSPATVMTAPLLAEVFGLRSVVRPHPITGHPHVYPLGRLDPATSPLIEGD